MSDAKLLKIIQAPIISEKTTNLADESRYFAFKIVPQANKLDVRNAVEMLFDVKVADVKIVNSKGKAKRFGQQLGKRKNQKKAYVRLKEGFDIDYTMADKL